MTGRPEAEPPLTVGCPLCGMGEAPADPHPREREMIVDVDYPGRGAFRTVSAMGLRNVGISQANYHLFIPFHLPFLPGSKNTFATTH